MKYIKIILDNAILRILSVILIFIVIITTFVIISNPSPDSPSIKWDLSDDGSDSMSPTGAMSGTIG